MNFIEFLENLSYDEDKIILKKGEILYHGTIESFDSRELRVGSYDKIFWTTNNYMIARSYIPTKGSCYLVLSTVSIINDSKYENLRKQIGLNKKVISKAYNLYKNNFDKITELEKEIEKLKQKLKEIEDYAPDEELDLLFKDWGIKEEELINLKRNFKYYEYYLEKFIIFKMKKFGYEFNKNYRGFEKVSLDKNNMLLKNEFEIGRVLQLELLKDLKICDIGVDESDLTSLEYNNLSKFRDIEENTDYDGISINDFVNTDYHGPYPHKSIGFFERSLKYIKVKQIKNQTHPKEEEWRNGN